MSFGADLCAKAHTLWHLQRVKQMLRARAQPGPGVLITVSQVDCPDPVCPGPATQITILGFDLRRRTLLIHRPVAQITAADLDRVAT